MVGKPKKLSVTAVLHPDTGIITAFINQFPGLVVQGKNDADVQKKLSSAFKSYAAYVQKLQNLDLEIQTQSFA